MKPITITLLDGSTRSFPEGTTAGQIAKELGLEKRALAASLDGGQPIDLFVPIERDTKLSLILKDSPAGLDILRHSTAHLLAHAVKEIYPNAQITIGPVIPDGFYYDIDCEHPFTPQDLQALEKKMEEIAGRRLEVTRKDLPKPEASAFFRNQGEIYKAEIIDGIPEPTVSLYTQGNFTDLCRGPHVPNTGRLGAFKLLSVAGAYWRGDEKNKMLQRIYGTAFASKDELKAHLERLEEAKRRDHRKLAPEMGLFTFLQHAPAMPFFLPKGAILHNTLIQQMREYLARSGYQEVICPQLMSTDLWAKSGHLDHYKQNMFVIEEEEGRTLSLKPMNCPGHALLYRSTKRSYRELPIRFAEFTKVHRNERAGVTHGILRVRNFSIDDGHIFCAEEQLKSEVSQLIRQTFDVYRKFGFEEVDLKVATRPDDSMGTEELWNRAIGILEDSLKAEDRSYTILPKEGAFYGPKIEFHIRDSIGRYWQCGTVQLDYNMAERFDLEYVSSEGNNRRPVVIHRAIFGSLERFLGILIEHYAGHLPLWIAPVQAVLVNVTAEQEAYVLKLEQELRSWGMRIESDLRNEKLGYKIREAQLKKIPLMLVIGNKEVEQNRISVRKSNGETLDALTWEAFREFVTPLLA